MEDRDLRKNQHFAWPAMPVTRLGRALAAMGLVALALAAPSTSRAQGWGYQERVDDFSDAKQYLAVTMGSEDGSMLGVVCQVDGTKKQIMVMAKTTRFGFYLNDTVEVDFRFDTAPAQTRRWYVSDGAVMPVGEAAWEFIRAIPKHQAVAIRVDGKDSARFTLAGAAEKVNAAASKCAQ